MFFRVGALECLIVLVVIGIVFAFSFRYGAARGDRRRNAEKK
jgi:heme/copper-type cytochrome/quinol oxidase subunit 2